MKIALRKVPMILACATILIIVPEKANGIDFSEIVGFIETYLGPYIKDIRLNDNQIPLTSQSPTQDTVERIIKNKIVALKTQLQDYDKVEVPSNVEETTIIEFLPKNNYYDTKEMLRQAELNQTLTTKPDVQKYKKMRKKIIKYLAKESVSSKTKKFLTKAFDDLIDQLLRSQCTWKPRAYNIKDTSQAYPPYEVAQAWKQQWDRLRKEYFDAIKIKAPPVTIKDLVSVFESFNDFFSQIIVDINKMSLSYQIRCRLIEKNNTPKSGLKTDKDCNYYKVCSTEMKEIFQDFYKNLNETTISSFKNYAAMYSRDVNTDGSAEGNTIISVINDAALILEKKVAKIYIKQLNDFRLDDKKNLDNNIELIKTFIKNTIEKLKTKAKKLLEKKMKKVQIQRLRLSVLNDINLNLDVELGKLERKMNNKTCHLFETCNGRVQRRSSLPNEYESKLRSENEVYVKLQLDLEDGPKGIIIPSARHSFNSGMKNGSLDKYLAYEATLYNRYKQTAKSKTSIDYQKYSNITVTRTTAPSSETAKPNSVSRLQTSSNTTHSQDVDSVVIGNRTILIMDSKYPAKRIKSQPSLSSLLDSV